MTFAYFRSLQANPFMKGRIGQTVFWRTNKEHWLGCDPNMRPGGS